VASPQIALAPDDAPSWLRGAITDGGGTLVAPEEAEGLVWFNPMEPEALRPVLASSPARWVQLPWAGIEPYVSMLTPDRLWTCGKGVYAEATGEHALALALAMLRDLPRRVRAGHWEPRSGISLFDRRVTIVGGGGIGEVLLALGRANWLLRFTALWFVASLASFAIGVQWGIIGVATAYSVVTLLIEPLRTYLTARALGTSAWRFLRALGGVAQATVVMAAFLLPLRAALVAAHMPAAARLLILVAAGGVVYIAACLWRAPEITSEIRSALGRRRRSADTLPAAVEAPLERV